MPKLTTNYVETKIQAPEQGYIIIRDDELQGFGMRVTATSKSYIAECRVAGKVRRVTIGRHGKPWTPETARKQVLVILGEMAAGVDPVKKKEKDRTTSLTLQQAFDDYVGHKEFRKSTRYNYPRIMKKELGDWLDMPVTAITKGMVTERFNKISSGTQLGTSGKASANLTMAILQAVLNFVSIKYELDGEPLLPSNPVARLTQTRAWHRLPQRQGTIPDHKLPAFYRAVQNLVNPNAKDYFIVLLLTGLRRNEAAQLKWTDIDFEEKTLTLQSTIAKNGYEHKLPLSTQLFEILSRRSAAKNGSEYVFPGYNGKGRYWGCYRTLRKMREQCGCNFTIHDLRRAFLTQAERLDTSPYVLRKLAGHSMREDMTAGYLVIDVERLRPQMQRISDRFEQLMNVKSARLIEAACWQVALTS